ncbi:MAG: SUMF1/EgtB/PvdO family nonheme iron enzyme [Chloroflexi bacterium]|nr:SUMF1/EgtB/PvdO family nonheme iron enzyme [Chloroflexota bacterium]
MPEQIIKIFISYRRDDSQYVTDNIHDHLIRHFGEENVFLDVQSIPFGVDFRQYLAEQVAGNDVVLCIIGPNWARLMKERASQQNDFVRIEIESALEQRKLIVPVLVMEAQMPNFADLPPSIAPLQWLQAATIRRKPDLESDCARLAKSIRQYIKKTPALSTDDINRGKLAEDSRALQSQPVIEEEDDGDSITAMAIALQQAFQDSDFEYIGDQPFSDSTLPASHDILPPPFDWIDIPARQVTLKGAHGTFNVPAFNIAKYPVTIAQYKVFMDDNGYTTDRWWTKSGWHWIQREGHTTPDYWNYEKWHSLWHSDHPVVGISWFEAYAFTQWLSEKTGENIFLPTEWQWQRAAQGSDYDRIYPWGNDWNSSRCNNDVDGRDWQKRRDQGNTTSPVTRYEGKGDSPFGVVDMAGNVWEWTNLESETAQPVDTEDTNVKRVIRGGSWYDNNIATFHVTYGLGFSPDARGFGIGFRCARSSR